MKAAEGRFFRACEEQLNDEWTVLYEQHWHGRRNGRNQMGEAGEHAAGHDDGKIPRSTARSSFSPKRSVEPAGDHGYPGRSAVPARGTDALE